MTMHVEGTPVSAPTSTSPRTAPLVRGAPLLGPLPGLLRGRFDYVSLSTDDLDRVERFAILVATDDAGATVLEAAPPPR